MLGIHEHQRESPAGLTVDLLHHVAKTLGDRHARADLDPDNHRLSRTPRDQVWAVLAQEFWQGRPAGLDLDVVTPSPIVLGDLGDHVRFERLRCHGSHHATMIEPRIRAWQRLILDTPLKGYTTWVVGSRCVVAPGYDPTGFEFTVTRRIVMLAKMVRT